MTSSNCLTIFWDEMFRGV